MAGDRKSETEKKSEKHEESVKLDDELDDTFPASDPPASTAPGRGETGALNVRKEREQKEKRD